MPGVGGAIAEIGLRVAYDNYWQRKNLEAGWPNGGSSFSLPFMGYPYNQGSLYGGTSGGIVSGSFGCSGTYGSRGSGRFGTNGIDGSIFGFPHGYRHQIGSLYNQPGPWGVPGPWANLSPFGYPYAQANPLLNFGLQNPYFPGGVSGIPGLNGLMAGHPSMVAGIPGLNGINGNIFGQGNLLLNGGIGGLNGGLNGLGGIPGLGGVGMSAEMQAVYLRQLQEKQALEARQLQNRPSSLWNPSMSSIRRSVVYKSNYKTPTKVFIIPES